MNEPWPWYVAGPLIGLLVPILLLLGNKPFGMSTTFRTMCSIVPSRAEFLRTDWKRGAWNLALALGIMIGAFIAATFMDGGNGLVPADVFSWSNLLTLRGALLMIGGGFLIGFGTAYGGGCSSGHGIMGLAALELASAVALVATFIGGLLATYLLLPLLV